MLIVDVLRFRSNIRPLETIESNWDMKPTTAGKYRTRFFRIAFLQRFPVGVSHSQVTRMFAWYVVTTNHVSWTFVSFVSGSLLSFTFFTIQYPIGCFISCIRSFSLILSIELFSCLLRRLITLESFST
jgi:hypothetical protein